MALAARVLVSYGNRGIVETSDGKRMVCSYRRSVGRPYCGDRVAVEMTGDDQVLLVGIEPRDNEFARANARFQKQVIAANLDQVLVVIAPEPLPSTDLVERYLVAIHSLGISPVIVLNKSELVAQRSTATDNPLSHLDEYRELGYPVLATSCKGEPGTKTLWPVLTEKTSILVGQSGVGKSSLINQIIPDLDLQTGELSRVTGKGTHTTTTTIMYALPCAGRLIDSPGVWEYGLWRMEPRELEDGFIDFHPFDGQCKFNDCRHAGEPGCAILTAVEQGQIKRWRYQSYLRLLEQNR
ncbi:MAG: ribosome small subunit-dependent GTPase A [Xanthomonadales bacterium]|jgi:ribosome biogenesis GTPase|nr:ribosome small subunit-dependent GTPase A [Xanthomonadales bacterium]MDH4000224.1 ribosome small subunit-dependent GTPase A [Xanthomonadales bacterium]